MLGSLALGLDRSTHADSIHQPRGRNDEQRRQEEAEQRIQPDQRNVEAAEPEADPESAKRTVSFQASAPDETFENFRTTYRTREV